MSPALASVRRAFNCTSCSSDVVKWAGRCPHCLAWGSVTERPPPTRSAPQRRAPTQGALPLADIDARPARAVPTGLAEFDRVLGGGLVPGSVILLAGEPGAGKSTLLLAAAAGCAGVGLRVLLLTGEESVAQVRLRAERTGSVSSAVLVAAETELGAVLAHLDAHQPDVVILDSVQTVSSADVVGAPGSVTQVREVAGALTRAAKERGLVCLLVGHVTKDGAIAGPRALEHLVDVVLHFEGERTSTLRLLRGVKNRFGAADEIGCFEMTETGIVGVADPSGRFLSRGCSPTSATPGSCVTVAVEGRRPLLAEVQALISPIGAQQPQRRSVSGLDAARVAMVVAVVERHGQLKLGPADIYAATVAGMRLTDPAADLALALALASAHHNRPLPPDLVAVGEVGLAGEIRAVRDVARRLRAGSRLGFRRALVPPGAIPAAGGSGALAAVADVADVVEAADVAAALRLVGLQEPENRR